MSHETMSSDRLGSPLSSRPLPAQTDDGNQWEDGPCWLWCGREETRVIWLGPAQTAGGVVAPFTACGLCVQRLHDRIWDTTMAVDRGAPKFGSHAVNIPQHVSSATPEDEEDKRPRSARHRRPAGLWRS